MTKKSNKYQLQQQFAFNSSKKATQGFLLRKNMKNIIKQNT